MTLQFSRHIESDLQRIVKHIAKDSPESATRFLRRLYAEFDQIAANAALFPRRDDLRQGIRMAVLGHYLIFFTVRPDRIRIERVLHGMRNLPAQFR